MPTHEEKLALLHQAEANVTALHGERPRGGRYQDGPSPYPQIDVQAFVADLNATFAGSAWDAKVRAEYRRLEAISGRRAA